MQLRRQVLPPILLPVHHQPPTLSSLYGPDFVTSSNRSVSMSSKTSA